MVVVYGRFFLLGLLALFAVQVPLLRAVLPGCPLDLRVPNFTPLSAACSSVDKGKCCRYINSYVAVLVARYANATGALGVSSNLSEICIRAILETIERQGVPPTAKSFCGLGIKIPVNFQCEGQTTITGMLQILRDAHVTEKCKGPLLEETNCNKCIDSSVTYLRNLTRVRDNMTRSICRDATFAALASEADNFFAVANCFFGVHWLIVPPVQEPPQSPPALEEFPVSPSPSSSIAPEASSVEPIRNSRSFHLTLVPGVGIAVTLVSLVMLVVLVCLIQRKSKELEDSENIDKISLKAYTQPKINIQEVHIGASSFRKFSYKETKKATDNFKTVIGEGGFGTVYKAQFSDGFVAAVKRMKKPSQQHEDEFYREIQLLAKLHHRHLVALRGFCINKHERFLVYEYMPNGSLKDHLHPPDKFPLSWKIRVQIAINVANALEYLHFYCDPPLCHRDIKSSNILLNENFVAKVADFGLAHAARIGSICFEPVNTDIQGTPGYMDPEYMVTQELTEKSDVYSYGVLLLELVTARHAIQGKENIVEWYQKFMTSESRLSHFVDPKIRDSFDLNQLQTILKIVRWCTQRERLVRPSIQEVLGLLNESSDSRYHGFVKTVEEEEDEGSRWITARTSEQGSDEISRSWDDRGLAHSSSTSRSYCSRSILIENGSPQSPLFLGEHIK